MTDGDEFAVEDMLFDTRDAILAPLVPAGAARPPVMADIGAEVRVLEDGRETNAELLGRAKVVDRDVGGGASTAIEVS